jgi:tRNA(fMet)-specific endonuclease VapC
MTYVLDTNIAIHLRDGEARIDALIDDLDPPLRLSIVTRIELEADLGRGEPDIDRRRDRLLALLRAVPVLPFQTADADVYRTIVGECGFSRRKVLDRMIAAQAIVAGATLVTLNGADFRDVPGLKLLEW